MAEIIFFIVCALLPAYGWRFKIGPLPTTGLELVVLAAIGVLAYKIIVTPPTSPYPKGRASFFPLIKMVGDPPSLKISEGRRTSYQREAFSAGVGYDKLFWFAIILIVASTIIGIIVAPGKLAALGIARAYFWEPIIFALLLVKVQPKGKTIFKAALYGFALNAVVIIGYGIFQYFFPRLIPATYAADHRITSFYSYPNAIALYLAPLIPLFLSALWSLPLVIFGLVAILMAKSAGGLIAAGAALFVAGLLFKKFRVITLVAALLLGVALGFAPQLSGLREQILMKDWSGRVHQIGWQESVAMLRDHPLWGAGLSGYPTVVKPYHTAQGVEIFQYPHNLFLTIWSELGLLGVIGFILLFIWFFKAIISTYKLQPTSYNLKLLAAAITAILIHGLVDVPYFKNDLSLMFWILIAITAIMKKEYARGTNK